MILVHLPSGFLTACPWRTEGRGVHWIHSDHLHSATILTDESGAEVRRLAYRAFGEELENQGSGSPPTYTYTGKELDSSGLMYYGARYYDPALARFITPDTVYDVGPQGLNRYSYALNNPVLYRDPSGHFINGPDDDENPDGYGTVTGSPEQLHDGSVTVHNYYGTHSLSYWEGLAGGATPNAMGKMINSSTGQFLGDMWHDFDTLNLNDPHYATLYYADKAAETSADNNAIAECTFSFLAGVAEIGPHALELLSLGLDKIQQVKNTIYISYSGMAQNQSRAFVTARQMYRGDRLKDYSGPVVNKLYKVAVRLKAEKSFMATNIWTYLSGKGVLGIGRAYGRGAKLERIAAIRGGKYLGQIPYVSTRTMTSKQIKDTMLLSSKGIMTYTGVRLPEEMVQAYINVGH